MSRRGSLAPNRERERSVGISSERWATKVGANESMMDTRWLPEKDWGVEETDLR